MSSSGWIVRTSCRSTSICHGGMAANFSTVSYIVFVLTTSDDDRDKGGAREHQVFGYIS